MENPAMRLAFVEVAADCWTLQRSGYGTLFSPWPCRTKSDRPSQDEPDNQSVSDDKTAAHCNKLRSGVRCENVRQIRRCWNALATAAARLSTLSLPKMLATWVEAVRWLMKRASPISR